jgi:hypothetical protein
MGYSNINLNKRFSQEDGRWQLKANGSITKNSVKILLDVFLSHKSIRHSKLGVYPFLQKP